MPNMCKLPLLLAALYCYIAHISSASAENEMDMDGPFNLSDIVPCQIDSAERDRCIRETLQLVMPKLRNGCDAIHVPPLDPLAMKNLPVKVDQRGSTNIYIDGTARVQIIGMQRMEIRNVSSIVTGETSDMEMEIYIPYLNIDGTYKGKGRVNGITMSNKIGFNITMRKYTMTVKFSGVFENRNGERYLNATDMDVELTDLGELKAKFKNVYIDDQLDKIVSDFVTENWKYIYKRAMPIIRPVWVPVALDTINEVFNNDIPIRAFMYNSDEEIYRIANANRT